MDPKFLKRFVVVWFVNSLAFYLANLFYPQNMVLGNANFSALTAAFVSGFLLTLLLRIAKPFIVKFGVTKMQGRFAMFFFYFLANSFAIWILAKMAPVSGFGISKFYWAFELGFVVSLVQWLARQCFKTLGWQAK